MFMQIIFLFVLAVGRHCDVYGSLEDHFKPISGKSPQNTMKNVDFIYMINLDERPEKFEKSIRQLMPYGIVPYRFSAVNGWRLPLEVLNDVGVKYEVGMDSSMRGGYYDEAHVNSPGKELMATPNRNYFCYDLSRGAIGIVFSHMFVLKDAYDSGYETIWVMEDDIQVCQNPQILSSLIDKLDFVVGKGNWDVLFTDPDSKNRRGEANPCSGYALRPNFSPENPGRFAAKIDIDDDFRKIGARFGAYSMIIRRSGIEKIFNFINRYKVFLPYDLDFYLPNDINLYTLRYDVVSTIPNALSDNGKPRYSPIQK